jgi:tRNA A-37 threonylcarbamoyl transferase component Bud32
MATTLEAIQSAIGDSYRLLRPIGRGGMATVYLADDLKHRRKVAVKVLRPELAEALGSDRFLKEIEIAAGLTHPHILPLHDSCDTVGCLYYVMPYVDGESLRVLMNRIGIVEYASALQLVQQVASALTYAHRRGVVHRDIKPENILLSEGHAVVADFGIAKAISTAGGVHLTRTGFPLGTPGYMSPEQAVGRTDLNEKTDIYSLACVFYEMVIGETPEMWPTEEATRLGSFVDASASHRTALDRLPGTTEQVLVKAMALRPDDRYGTPDEFAAALAASFGEKRQYRHTEAKELVRRAADMQLQEPTRTDALSLGGVQRIAAEVGIPPHLVDRAARSVDRTEEPVLGNAFLGARRIMEFERVVAGEVPESEYPELVDEIRNTLGTVGEIDTLSRSLTWRTPPIQGGRQVSVTVRPRAGRTTIRIQERLNALAGGLYGGIMGGVGGGGFGMALGVGAGAAGLPVVAALGIAGALVGGSYLRARAIFRATARGRAAELNGLIDRLAEHVVETAVVQRQVTPR